MKNSTRHRLLSLLSLSFAACQSGGYMSSVALTGAVDRHQVVESITEGVTEQQVAKDEFAAAGRILTTLQTAGEVEAAKLYPEYLDQIDRCARQVERLADQVTAIRIGADRLFVDWELELEQFTNEAIRDQSAERLRATRSGFALLHEELTGVHAQMLTSLCTHRDYALYFNHNLAGSSRELLGSENARFAASMAAMRRDCSVVESDATTFNERLTGPRPAAPAPAAEADPAEPDAQR